MADCDWHFDLDGGVLYFADQQHWRVQLLGTESEASNTWLWAWANTESNIPAHLLVASLALKAYGERHGIPELTTPELTLDRVDPHTLALLASGVCDANAYYRCPYEGGALYVLIMDENFPTCPDPPLRRVATVFPQAIASLDIPDHEAALCGYLDHYGLDHEHTDNQIVVRGEDGQPLLTATFDDQKRLTSLEARLGGQADSTDEDTTPEKRSAENNAEVNEPPESRPAESLSAESWDEAQMRRMLGG